MLVPHNEEQTQAAAAGCSAASLLVNPLLPSSGVQRAAVDKDEGSRLNF